MTHEESLIQEIQAAYPSLDRLMIQMVLDTPDDMLEIFKASSEENERRNPYKTPAETVLKAVEISDH